MPWRTEKHQGYERDVYEETPEEVQERQKREWREEFNLQAAVQDIYACLKALTARVGMQLPPPPSGYTILSRIENGLLMKSR